MILALLCGMCLYFLSVSNKYARYEVVRIVEQNLTEQFVNQSKYLESVLSATPNWCANPKFYQNADFPVYIYSENVLICWNEHRFEPIFESVNQSNEIGLITIGVSHFTYQLRNVKHNGESYQLLSLIPLVIDYEISNQYLTSRNNDKIFPDGVSFQPISGKKDEVIKYKEVPLFAVDINESAMQLLKATTLVKSYIVVLVFCLFLFMYLIAIHLGKHNVRLGFIILSLGLIVIRSAMIMLKFPNDFIIWDFFDSKVYVSSEFNPSLGDLLFNLIALQFIALYVFSNRKLLTQWVNKEVSPALKWLIKLSFFVLTLWLITLNYRIVFDILSNSQISLDISKSIDFTFLRSAAYLAVISIGIIYFFIVHSAHRIIFNGPSSPIQVMIKILIPGLIIFIVLEMLYHDVIWTALIIQIVYLLVIYLYNLPKSLSGLRFNSILYLVITIIILSATWALAVYKAFEDQEKISKEKFETKLLLDRDLESEFLFKEIMSKIQTDVSLNARIMNPQSSIPSIVEMIKRSFLSGYFNQYHVYINLYDNHGNPLNPDSEDIGFYQIKEQLDRSMSVTDFNDIYYEGNISTTGRRRYVCLVELERYGNKTGHVVMDFQLKKQISHSVYPELLLDNKGLEKKDFDYAVYIKDILVYNSGSYNYAADFNPRWLTETKLREDGIERNGFHHLAVQGYNKMLIVTSRVYSNWSIASNFSFFLLLFSVVVIFIVSARYLFGQPKSLTMNFSTKILLYLGAAFAIPLALVSAGILNTINESYKKEIDKSYEKKVLALSEVMIELLDQFESNKLNRENLSTEVAKIADNSRTDLTVYDAQGRLLTTSQPTIFIQRLLSHYINPEALFSISDKNRNKTTLNESIGLLNYKTAYVAIRSYEDGHLLGILGSPYFSSKNHLSRQSTEVFNNIINISTLIFIISIGLIYLGVSRLTNPIILIAARLKKIGLEEHNQPLEWKADDEIGVLVKEYNLMLTKLEKSRRELARNEKEAAWREMAKQVAHEIKNPLTPMKLTLQHLDRTIEKNSPTKNTVKTLLQQIDTLDQIVTSFSHFAKMPDPEQVEFDLKAELESIVNLHPDRLIETKLDTGPLYMRGDKKLFGRIFNNIILNAFQAMSKLENAKMVIELHQENSDILLKFIDYGPGIPEDIKEKVFIPNFSTKDSGSGIGLAVAKRGIEHAGGSIWFESNEKTGTTFFIRLPLIHHST